jgi:hypothetical protein
MMSRFHCAWIRSVNQNGVVGESGVVQPESETSA